MNPDSQKTFKIFTIVGLACLSLSAFFVFALYVSFGPNSKPIYMNDRTATIIKVAKKQSWSMDREKIAYIIQDPVDNKRVPVEETTEYTRYKTGDTIKVKITKYNKHSFINDSFELIN